MPTDFFILIITCHIMILRLSTTFFHKNHSEVNCQFTQNQELTFLTEHSSPPWLTLTRSSGFVTDCAVLTSTWLGAVKAKVICPTICQYYKIKKILSLLSSSLCKNHAISRKGDTTRFSDFDEIWHI